jgi:F0F1-type ATP synthase assembly protein I
MTNYVTFVVGEVLLLILTICSMAAIFPRVRDIVQLCLEPSSL